MNITLYENFSKKRNSTKQPTGGTQVTARMKRDTSTENPIFLLSNVDLDVNYVGFNGGYYFVDDIVLGNDNIYELHCSIDVLATWKTLIGSYTGFVERSETAYDIMINDAYITPTQDIKTYSAASTSIGAFYGSGCFVIQVMSQDGITLYACESLEPWGFILNPASYDSQTIFDWIDKKIAQSFDLDVYIGSVKWLPMNASSLDDGSGVIGTLKIGPLNTVAPSTVGQRTYRCSQRNKVRSSLTLSLPTGSLPYNDFRLCNRRFTQWCGYFPGVGTVDLDPSIFGEAAINSRTITCDVELDLVSGNVCYNLITGLNNSRIAEFNGNVSVDVPIGKSSYNVTRQISTAAGGVAGIAAGIASENYAKAIASGVGAAMSVADNAINPQVSILSGGGGNKAQIEDFGNINITYKAVGSRDIPLGVYGRPLYGWRLLNTLSGFIKCNAASIDIPGAGPNKDAVNAYLNGGFYYE